jgi:hypothetical protein
MICLVHSKITWRIGCSQASFLYQSIALPLHGMNLQSLGFVQLVSFQLFSLAIRSSAREGISHSADSAIHENHIQTQHKALQSLDLIGLFRYQA